MHPMYIDMHLFMKHLHSLSILVYIIYIYRNMNLKGERIKYKQKLQYIFFMPLWIFNLLREFHCTSDTTEFKFKGLCDLASTQIFELTFWKFPFSPLYLSLSALLTVSCKQSALSCLFFFAPIVSSARSEHYPFFASRKLFCQTKQKKFYLLHQKTLVQTNQSLSTWLVSPS